MLKKGSLILQLWCLINVLPGIGSLVYIALGKHAPGLRMLYAVEEISGLDARVLATIDGIGTLANALIVVYCLTAFFIISKCLRKGKTWAFFVLATGTALHQIAGYASDWAFFMGKNLAVLNISSLFLLIGFSFCGIELFKKSGQE